MTHDQVNIKKTNQQPACSGHGPRRFTGLRLGNVQYCMVTLSAKWKRSYKMRHLTSIITVGSVEPAVSRHLKLQVRFKPFCLNADNLLKVLSCINVVMTGIAFLI